MAARSPAVLSPGAFPAAPGIGRWSIVLAASVAGLALAGVGVHAGWPVLLSAIALTVHGGLAVAGGWHLYVARETHRELVQRVTLLQAEQASMRAGAADVAHDMRAPIVTIRSYLELLACDAFGPLPEAAREAAAQAVRASTRAHSLLEATLAADAVHDAEPAVSDATDASVDLRAVLSDVIDSLGAEIARTAARVDVGPLPRVHGAEATYYRIFENLVQNAVRYHRPGASSHVAIEALEHADAVEIDVRDDGVGIPLADRERVFERHVRGVAGAAFPGHGLGLATVRELVTGVGGTVWIDPAVRDGTCVRLRLPR